MASKSSASLALFLALNLLIFTLVSSCDTCPSSKPKAKQTLKSSPRSSSGKCPIDALKLGVCVDVLGPLLNIALGTPPNTPCCSLIAGLVDLEAALCLCISIKASVLGINLNIPLSLSLLVNYCGKKVPQGFQCP